MSANSTTFRDDATEGSSAKEKLSEAASQAKDKASDLGRAAVDKINENRSTASAGLQSAADTATTGPTTYLAERRSAASPSRYCRQAEYHS